MTLRSEAADGPRAGTDDRELAEALRGAGLTTRTLAAWAGTERIAALRGHLSRLVADEPTPAAAALAMFVAGARVPVARLSLLGGALDVLVRRGLVEIDGDHARATVAIVPLGSSLLVCDHVPPKEHHDLVCWPDDSSHHLAAALPPGRRDRWLDLGCGSAFAPLARPELAAQIAGADINPRALHYAALGASLSQVPLVLFGGDLGAAVPASWRGACELVTCNAPIPDGEDPERAVWRTAGADIIARIFETAAAFVSPDGIVVVHAALEGLLPLVSELPGERVVVAYTPEDLWGFGIAWWRPGGPTRIRWTRRLLTIDRPHLTHEDRERALST